MRTESAPAAVVVVVMGATLATAGTADAGLLASVPPERRRRRICEKALVVGALCEVDIWRAGAPAGRRLWFVALGDGGRGIMGDWASGGGGESRVGSIGAGWDWEVPRGRDRKNEPRMVCLTGGDSFPAGSMRSFGRDISGISEREKRARRRRRRRLGAFDDGGDEKEGQEAKCRQSHFRPSATFIP